MFVHVTPGSGPPIYQQIVSQIKYLIAAGQLVSGDELPTIRALGEQLLINPNTVARAYRELEAAGLVASKVGSGTRVTGGVSPLARHERLRILNEQIDALLATANQLGFDVEEVVHNLQKRHRGMKGK